MTHRSTRWWELLLDEARERLGDGDKPGAARTARRLLDTTGLPPRVEWEARSIEFNSVVRLEDLCATARVGQLALEVEPGWSRFNPSIAADGEGGARCIVRSANYRLGRGGRYELLEESNGVIMSCSYLCELTQELELAWAVMIDDDCGVLQGEGRIRGFEDLRLFAAGDSWSALATTMQGPRHNQTMVRLDFDDDCHVSSATVLDGPYPGRHEKNWMPIADGHGTRAVHEVRHTTVVGIDTARTLILQRHRAPLLARTFRGGSQLIEFGGGWLAVVHEAWQWPDGRRSYVHRFVSFNRDLVLWAVSAPFSFLHDGVEFCAGMAHVGTSLVLTAGVQDAEAILVTVTPEEVQALLEPLQWETPGVLGGPRGERSPAAARTA